MFQYLAISDGTTTVELTDMANYALVSYAPTIAPLRDNDLGGSGPFEDVGDTLIFHALGETAALAYANADAVNRLLDQARRWWRGETVNAVTISAQAQGATDITSYVAALKGRSVGGPPNMALPATWSEYYNKYIIQNIQIQCGRRGQFLHGSENASAAAAANPAVLSVAMPSSPAIPGPLKLQFTGFTTDGSGSANIPSCYAFVGPVAAFSLQQGEAAALVLAAAASFASTADAAARASAGSVGRLNHAAVVLGAESLLYWTLPAAFLNSTRIAIYCTYRTNTAAPWTIRGEAYRTVAPSLAGATTPYQTIPGAASNPTVLFVGIVGSAVGFDTAGLRIARTGSVGTDTIDIDTIVFVDVSDPEVYVVALANTGSTISTGANSKNIETIIDNDPNTRPLPFVHTDVLTTAIVLMRGYTGDAALTVSGSPIGVIWYATHTTFWTTQNIAFSATLNIGATITRRLAASVPQ